MPCAEETQQTLQLADDLHKKGEFQRAHDVLKVALDKDCENPELLWRFARACCNLSEETQDKHAKEAYARVANETAGKALKASPDNAASHKIYAISLKCMNEHLGAKEKIHNVVKVREHVERSIQLDPSDPMPHHMLGRWCCGVAGMNWVQRKLAASMSSKPLEATYEEALAHLMEASRLDPTFKRNMVAIGDVCVALKKTSEAKEWYTRALATKGISASEIALDDHVRGVMKKL